MRRHAIALLALGLVASVACGGRPAVFLDEQDDAVFELPDPVPAAPAFVARLSKPLKGGRFKKVSNTPGIAVLAPVSVRRLRVGGPAGTQRLRVASVDPLPFRSVAPSSTRDAEFVWTALMSDRAVLTQEAAAKVGLARGGQITIARVPVEVGAFADNGIPNIADVVVSAQLARSLELGRPNILVVGAKSGVTFETLGKDLKRRLPGARLARIKAVSSTVTRPPAPQNVGQVSGATIGTMTFRILESGFIDPDPSWVAANIAGGSVPILGGVRCHRIMLPQLGGALGEIARVGLSSAIRPGDFGGCYVPRFIDRNPRRGLSMHAFGLAVDLNVSTNGLGTRGDMDPRVVAIFDKWGFAWGGRWSRPDPMHFELARIVRR